eukprot:scaffold11275_cov15-Tisochrysis_lutea.AAC.1
MAAATLSSDQYLVIKVCGTQKALPMPTCSFFCASPQVVENWNMKTCIRDDRKCLQGFGVWGSQEACCAPGAAFNEGCGK